MRTVLAYAIRILVGITVGILLCLLIDAGKEAERIYLWLNKVLPKGDNDVIGTPPFWKDRE